MTRDFRRLSGTTFDLVVIGGGIHGLFAAYDAAQRGLRTALVDRDDFGGGISFNHQRTLHGGLRALQAGDVAKCRQQIRERRAWARIAPHLLRPLPFLLGTYRGTRRARTLVRAGFRLYDAIARDRNHDVLPELHLPKGRLESIAATRKLFPGITEAGLSGGAIWYDYQTVHPDRLTWCVALAAAAAGAVLCNYADAIGLERQGDRVSGVVVQDRTSRDSQTLPTTAVVVATGAGLPDFARAAGLPPAPPFVRAMNLLLSRPARDIALAATAASGRMYTLVPWQGQMLVGTWQDAAAASSASAGIPPEFVSDINSAFPALRVTPADVRFVHDAYVPARQRGGAVDLLPEPLIARAPGMQGLVTLVGVKYTTARLAAERAIDLVAPGRRSRTAHTILPHADVADTDGRLEEVARRMRVSLPADVQRHLASWYGTEAPVVLEASATGGHLSRLSAGSPVLEGEIVHAAGHASAVHLTDIVFRRTSLASAGLPAPDGLAGVARAAQLAGAVLGWDRSRQAEEVAAVRSRLTGF